MTPTQRLGPGHLEALLALEERGGAGLSSPDELEGALGGGDRVVLGIFAGGNGAGERAPGDGVLAADGRCPGAKAAPLRGDVLLGDVVPGDVLLGYALVALASFDAELEAILVAPQARGTGVAKALLRAVIESARDAGAERLLLEVRASNVAAIGLYQAAGLALDGVRRGYYPAAEPGQPREDACLMSLGLR